ncbi:helix-turn-helix domain-containing protein [Streptomyces albireticuli]|uniref:DNA-binding protein n=1 Tax=Streptomyces albireticuli TaxID=1940 RepID=A0A2A2D575_9ACTN|nr:helix-turn-helix transcriptional regulator [Streptomyces albireticuli]MCD9145684.1 helix-turn-helix domain-containing protein [Streptomyces albireticuli]MCD9165584.1 helix-turn-helix domain-containing protein [Streptomyces albireticuli]MCD9195893.1 helix-turn-helix domain-containing protein [Streptomyces albireticuli]PAU46596.1 DNA-binding protein [Streptomyces albireticuli]
MQQPRGRPMRDISAPQCVVGELAGLLRDSRRRTGLSRADLAQKIGRSLSTIQRAEAGETPPGLAVIQGYTRICGLDSAEVDKQWRAARRSLQGYARRTLTQAPRLNLIRNDHELGAALVRVWEENDEPSARAMARRAEQRYLSTREFALLSKNTAWRITKRRTLPSSEATLKAYLFACDVPERYFDEWVHSWRRVRERRKQEAAQREVAAVAEERERNRYTGSEARAYMRAVGLLPTERYPGATAPWAARCVRCEELSRHRLASVVAGQGCRVCSQYEHEGAADQPL